VADVGEEEAFVDDDVGGVLVRGGVGGALIGVPFPPHVCLAALHLVVLLLLHLLLPLLVFVHVTFTRVWTFK
jgi:fucose permease